MNNQNIDLIDLEDNDDDNESYPLEYFNLTATPNDFNISTIISFMERRVFQIPAFQRNFVWDIQKSSKLIESLIIGLPIPQIFLYEKERNVFSIIDGQQRLLSLYFFYKGRFPKSQEARLLLRNKNTSSDMEFIKSSILDDDQYFTNFALNLQSKNSPIKNKLHGFNFRTLDTDHRNRLELATIRNMVIKPELTKKDDLHLAMFEIFNRLNSGGMNLNQQEIRMTLYPSPFMQELENLNQNDEWRKLYGKKEPDLRLKDSELILRLFSMLIAGTETNPTRLTCDDNTYQHSLIAFLNKFANFTKKLDQDDVDLLKNIWQQFCVAMKDVSPNLLSNSSEVKDDAKVSIPVLEAIFFALCRDALDSKDINKIKKLQNDSILSLKQNRVFLEASIGKTTSKSNVHSRLDLAYKHLKESK